MDDLPVVAAASPLADRTGSVAIFIGLTLAILIGFSALGTEVVYAMFRQRQMQSAASAAALSAATASTSGHPVDFALEARGIAANAGFRHGTNGATVTVNRPPLRGSHAGVAGAVEVIIGQKQAMLMASLFSSATWNVSARAVALVGNNGGYCLLALNPANVTGVAISNGANINLNRCGMAVNAAGANALTVTGGAVLNASAVSVAGLTSVTNGGAINATNGIKTSQAAVADRYSGTPMPLATGCAHGSAGHPLTLSWQPTTLYPDGVYCGGLVMGNGGTVTMAPGVYIINGGTFSIQGGVTLTGTGVTIVLTGTGTNFTYTTVSIANGANVTLSAPTSGATAGLVFFQDPRAPANGTNSFQGGASLKLTGALYFPSQTVIYANGATSSSSCTQLVASQIKFAGGATFNSNCANTGVQSLGASPSHLVE